MKRTVLFLGIIGVVLGFGASAASKRPSGQGNPSQLYISVLNWGTDVSTTSRCLPRHSRLRRNCAKRA
jgi:hypothetical protein